jgi:hypothetical protein
MRLSRETATNIQSFDSEDFADPKSMKNSSLRYFFNRVHLAHFDVNVWKPILE